MESDNRNNMESDNRNNQIIHHGFDFNIFFTGRIINANKIRTEFSKQNFYDQILSGHKELVNSNKFFEVANDLVTANMFPQFPWLLNPQKPWNLIIHISKAKYRYRIPGDTRPREIRKEIRSIDIQLDKKNVNPEKKEELSKRKKELKEELKWLFLLGEYKRIGKLGKVIIYINNIADYCDYILGDYSDDVKVQDFNNVLYSTYIHEMMHAYFDKPWEGEPRKQPIKEIEEPFAEFGMLDIINKYEGYADFNAVKKMVKEEQDCPEICYYGYGYYLFSLLENTTEDEEKESLRNLYYDYKTGTGDNAVNAREFFKDGYSKENEEQFLDYLKSMYNK